jgi:anti-anti-sigma factor
VYAHISIARERPAMIDDVLRLDVSHLDGRALITIQGDIDADSIFTLQVVLDELVLEQHILIDLAQVRFIDSNALNALISHSLRMGEAGGTLFMRNPSSSVRTLVEITGLGQFFCEPEGV